MNNEAKDSHIKPFECYCGATFHSETEYREHQKAHPQRGRAVGAGGERKLDPEIPREQGQTEEERHEWLETKDPGNVGGKEDKGRAKK